MRAPIPALLVLAALSGPAPADDPDGVFPPAVTQPRDDADALYGLDRLWDIHLTLTPDAWKAIQPEMPAFPGPGPFDGPPGGDVLIPLGGPPPGQAPNRPGGPPPRGPFNFAFPEVQAAMEFDGASYVVGLRFKGNSTYMMSAGGLKRPFKIDMNQYVKGQTLRGVAELNLSNNLSDPSMMREALAYAVFRRAGVPAPRTAFVRLFLTVPGEHDRTYLGLYTLVEPVDRRFLRSRFGTDQGALLKPSIGHAFPHLGADWPAYVERYEPKTPVKKRDADALITLTRLVNDPDPSALAAHARELLDVPQFLNFLAVNAAVANLDSLLAMGQNFYLWRDPASGRFLWFPWDLNMAFGGFPMALPGDEQAELSLLHPHAGDHPLIDRVLALPGSAAAYRAALERVAPLVTPEALSPDIDRVAALIRPAIADESDSALAAFDAALLPPASGGRQPPDPSPNAGPRTRRRPRFDGPMTLSAPPLRDFLARRSASIADQLAGRAQGRVPALAGFGPPGGPGGPPGGPPPADFGPGTFVARPIFEYADLDQDGDLTPDEAADAARDFLAESDPADPAGLDRPALRKLINATLGPPPGMFGGPPGGPPGPPGGPGGPPGGPPPGFGPAMFLLDPIFRAADPDKDRRVTPDEAAAAARAAVAALAEENAGRLDLKTFTRALNKALTPPPGANPFGFGP